MNRLKINIGKTQLMTLGGQSFKPKWQQVDVQLHGTTIPERDSVRYLGLTIDKDLSWKTHVSNVRKKAFAAIGCIRRASQYLPVKIRKMLYNSLVLPHLDYCSTVWHSCNQTLSQSLERTQNYAMRVILSHPRVREVPPQRPASLDYPPSTTSQPNAVPGAPVFASAGSCLPDQEICQELTILLIHPRSKQATHPPPPHKQV